MRTRKTALTEESFKQTLEGKEFMSPSCGGPVRVKGGRVILNGYEDVTENCDWSKLMDEFQAWNIGGAYSKMVASERTVALKDADGNDLQEGDTVVVVNDLAKEIFPSLYGQRFTITWTGMNEDRPEIQRLRLSNGPAVGGQGLFAPASFVRKEASNRMAGYEDDWSANDANGQPLQEGDVVRAKNPNEADETSLEDYTIVGYSYPQLKVKGKDGKISYVSPSGSMKVSSRSKKAVNEEVGGFRPGDVIDTGIGGKVKILHFGEGGMDMFAPENVEARKAAFVQPLEGQNNGYPYWLLDITSPGISKVSSKRTAAKYTGDWEKDFENTALMPDLVAESVAEDLAYGIGKPEVAKEYYEELMKQFTNIYKKNPNWAKKVISDSNSSRDYLAGFLTHWSASIANKRGDMTHEQAMNYQRDKGAISGGGSSGEWRKPTEEPKAEAPSPEEAPAEKPETPAPFNRDTLDPFVRAYLEAALWSSNDESDESGGQPMDANYAVEDLDPSVIEQATEECKAFQEEAVKAGIELDPKSAGHDFWLTRNHHGAGFWDRKEYDKETGKKLTDMAQSYGEVNLYIGDDGKVHGSGGGKKTTPKQEAPEQESRKETPSKPEKGTSQKGTKPSSQPSRKDKGGWEKGPKGGTRRKKKDGTWEYKTAMVNGRMVVAFTDSMGNKYECRLVDDGTMDTVVLCNGEQFRFSDVEREPDGSLSEEVLNNLFEEAIEMYEEGIPMTASKKTANSEDSFLDILARVEREQGLSYPDAVRFIKDNWKKYEAEYIADSFYDASDFKVNMDFQLENIKTWSPERIAVGSKKTAVIGWLEGKSEEEIKSMPVQVVFVGMDGKMTNKEYPNFDAARVEHDFIRDNDWQNAMRGSSYTTGQPVLRFEDSASYKILSAAKKPVDSNGDVINVGDELLSSGGNRYAVKELDGNMATLKLVGSSMSEGWGYSELVNFTLTGAREASVRAAAEPLTPEEEARLRELQEHNPGTGFMEAFDTPEGSEELKRLRDKNNEYIREREEKSRQAATSEEEWDAVLSDGFAIGDKVTPEGNSADPYYGQVGTVSGKDTRNGQAAPEDVRYTVDFPDGGYLDYYMDGLKKAASVRTAMTGYYSFVVKGNREEAEDAILSHGIEDAEFMNEAGNGQEQVFKTRTIDPQMVNTLNKWMTEGPYDAPYPVGSLLVWSDHTEENIGQEPDPFSGPSGMFAGAGRKARRAMKIGDHVTGMSLTLDGKDVRVAGVLLRHEFEDIYMVHTASGDVPVIEKDLRPAPKRYASISDEIQDLKVRKEILENGIDASENDDQKESFTARIDELDREINVLEAKTAMTDPKFFGHGLEHMADIEEGNIPTLTSPSTEEISDDAVVPLSMRPKGEHGEGAEYKSVLSRRERRRRKAGFPGGYDHDGNPIEYDFEVGDLVDTPEGTAKVKSLSGNIVTVSINGEDYQFHPEVVKKLASKRKAGSDHFPQEIFDDIFGMKDRNPNMDRATMLRAIKDNNPDMSEMELNAILDEALEGYEPTLRVSRRIAEGEDSFSSEEMELIERMSREAFDFDDYTSFENHIEKKYGHKAVLDLIAWAAWSKSKESIKGFGSLRKAEGPAAPVMGGAPEGLEEVEGEKKTADVELDENIFENDEDKEPGRFKTEDSDQSVMRSSSGGGKGYQSTGPFANPPSALPGTYARKAEAVPFMQQQMTEIYNAKVQQYVGEGMTREEAEKKAEEEVLSEHSFWAD